MGEWHARHGREPRAWPWLARFLPHGDRLHVLAVRPFYAHATRSSPEPSRAGYLVVELFPALAGGF